MIGHDVERTDTGARCSCGDAFTGAAPHLLWHAVVAHLRSADLAAAAAASLR